MKKTVVLVLSVIILLLSGCSGESIGAKRAAKFVAEKLSFGEEYSVIYNDRVTENDEKYDYVTVAEKREDSFVTIGHFYINCDFSKIFQYNILDGSLNEIWPTPQFSQSIYDMMKEANEAYSWFKVCTLSCSYDDQKEKDGMMYQRVTDERFKTYNDFYSYISSIFSQDITDKLFSEKQYADIDGALYELDGARGTNILIADVKYEAVSLTSDRCEYKAVVSFVKEPETTEIDYTKEYKFVRERKGISWLFTTFEFFY